jgi:xylose isomerase-like TIM barrel protein
MARTISLAPLTILELAPPDMITCAARAGYSHLGLRLHPVMPKLDVSYPIVGDTPMVREVQRRLDDTGLKVFDVEFIRITPDTCVADYIPMLETANLEPIPLFDVRTLAQAARVLALADRRNSGIVIDPIHFDRARERLADAEQIPRKWLHYMQLCDAPADRPADAAGMQFQARYERMIPGEGGLDLPGLLRALPRDIPIGIEVPMAALARTVGAQERARRLLAATRALLRRLEEDEGSGSARFGYEP